MRCRLLPAFEYRRERWQNGRGWTREILRDAHADWTWRCSVAEIDQDGAFSRFPERSRLMVLLQGEGLQLIEPEQGLTLPLLPPHGRLEYSGDLPLSARLCDGPCHALNLIWDPLRCAAELLHRPLVGPMVFFADDRACWLIYVLKGQARVRGGGDELLAGTGDSLWLSPDGPDGRVLLDGGGELLLLRITPTPRAPADAASAAP
jgi:environmental stress-induced protein Ves